jgi:F-type H+-transporting ATPase subunit b
MAAQGMPQFNAKTFYSQLFWLTLTFAALYLLITYLILPRIRENIRLRKNKIANDLERSEKIKIEIDKMINQSNIKIEEAKNQVKKTIKQTLARSDTEYKNQINTLKKQLSNKQIEAENRIISYKQTIDKEISKSIISLSALILSRLNYNNLSTDEIEDILKKSNASKNV